VTREQIDEGCRELVRRGVLWGWYTFMWSDGRKWTMCPPPDDGIPSFTKDRVGTVDYLQMAGVL